MTNQKQTPHFPCGPCPLQDEIFAQITHYRLILDNMKLYQKADITWKDQDVTDDLIQTVINVVTMLWNLYHLAEATLTGLEAQENL